jgi:transcriptional regulator with XRE-family HTH domain
VIGDLLRDLRLASGYSQTELATRLFELSGRLVERGKLSRWEAGKVIPAKDWLGYLSRALDVPFQVLLDEATLTRMDRRAFMSLTALVATHGKLATTMVDTLAAHDPGPLATMQTTHGTDLVIAHKVSGDKAATGSLRRWMADGETAVLRVNAAGILAKLPGQQAAEQISRVLAHDTETRQLYKTAVLARVGAIEWDKASAVVTGQAGALTPAQARFLAARLAAEAVNPRDAGARWCSAVMLRDISPFLAWEETR